MGLGSGAIRSLLDKIREIWRYPVKSMQCSSGWHGGNLAESGLGTVVSDGDLFRLHYLAHEHGFVANSVKTKVEIEQSSQV